MASPRKWLLPEMASPQKGLLPRNGFSPKMTSPLKMVSPQKMYSRILLLCREKFGIADGLRLVMLVCEFLAMESKIVSNQPPKTYHHFNCMLDGLERQVTSLISFVPLLCAHILSVLLSSELQIKFAYTDIDVGNTDTFSWLTRQVENIIQIVSGNVGDIIGD